MARFVHLADARSSRSIRRNGLKVSPLGSGASGVFCVPVVPDYNRTFQWARELRRRGNNAFVAIFFVIEDNEHVLLGHYGSEKIEVTAAEAHAFFRSDKDSLGHEVIVPRPILPAEIRSIGHAPRITGWRFFPGAKGPSPFWPLPGTKNAAKLRRSIEKLDSSYYS